MFAIKIILSKDFLLKVHKHPFLASVKDMPHTLIDGIFTDDEYEVTFSGSYNGKFKSKEDYMTFEVAFNNMLEKYKIALQHKYPLYYYINFFEQDIDRQNNANQKHNSLLEGSRFLIDLIEDSKLYIEKLEKDSEYDVRFDERTFDLAFVRKALLEANPNFNLVYHIHNPKRVDDVIQFTKMYFFNTEVYLHVKPSFNLKRSVKSKTVKRKSNTSIELPKSMQLSLFLSIVDGILEDQKNYNTLFYKEFNKTGGANLHDLNRFRVKLLKHKVSFPKTLTRIGVAIGDYLNANKILKSQTEIAAFLFDYFALFKAYRLNEKLPERYDELAFFYKKHGISPELIRTMLKDADKVGEISVKAMAP